MSNSKQPEYDMAKVQGLFVGYRKFAVDCEVASFGSRRETLLGIASDNLMNGPENGSL